MRALIVILAIIAIIAALTFIPVRLKVYALYQNSELDYNFKLKYGFVTIKNSKKTGVSPKHEKKDKKKDGDVNKNKPGVKNTIKFLRSNSRRIKKLVNSVVSYVTKHCIKIEKLVLNGVLGTDDAMNTAMLYGGASAFLYNSAGLLDKAIPIKGIAIDFKPDFTQQKIFVEFESIIKTRIYNIAVLAIIGVVRALPLIRKRGDLKNGKSN